MLNGLRNRAARFLQRPGTADLRPYLDLLPAIAQREQAIAALDDNELAPAAREAAAAADDAGLCALGREAARRGLAERPFDVQLVGTLAMLAGHVAEMATGEGKTLSGALAAAGYALRGRSVHVMSVNDYLARRDAEWMRPVYDLLGVTVGWIGQASTPADRRRAYNAQVTYGAVSEFGFDVLRDRLATSPQELIAGPPDVALIDEADSVLVDEALVPLVLAGAADAEEGNPLEMAELARRLRPHQDYRVDDDGRSVHLTNHGTRAVEAALGGIDLYTDPHLATLTRLNVALYAEALVRRDVDYIVRDGKIHLINASRGRVARLQRWPDGLHAAVEAKEGLAATQTGEILDSITIQSLVGRYPVVCGMTGTAVAVGEQLREFYGLEIAVIPPNRPCVRIDEPDRLFAAQGQKEKAVADHAAAVHATGRPVLIGTLDVAESERIAARLTRAGLQLRRPQRQERRRGSRDRGRGRRPRHRHRLHPDGGPRHRHPARRRRRRSRPDRRARRAARDRRRPARQQQARPSAAGESRASGGSWQLGVLRQPARRARHPARARRPAAGRDRAGRPDRGRRVA